MPDIVITRKQTVAFVARLRLAFPPDRGFRLAANQDYSQTIASSPGAPYLAAVRDR